jgi:hypothetical protein
VARPSKGWRESYGPDFIGTLPVMLLLKAVKINAVGAFAFGAGGTTLPFLPPRPAGGASVSMNADVIALAGSWHDDATSI